jgi:hypothetical protein
MWGSVAEDVPRLKQLNLLINDNFQLQRLCWTEWWTIVDDKLERICNESWPILRCYTANCLARQENPWKSSTKTVGLTTKIETQDLPNTKPWCQPLYYGIQCSGCRWTILSGAHHHYPILTCSFICKPNTDVSHFIFLPGREDSNTCRIYKKKLFFITKIIINLQYLSPKSLYTEYVRSALQRLYLHESLKSTYWKLKF